MSVTLHKVLDWHLRADIFPFVGKFEVLKRNFISKVLKLQALL
jgi:hypothetical protein